MPFEISKQLLLPHVLWCENGSCEDGCENSCEATAVKQQQLCMHCRPWWSAPKCVLA